MDTKQARTMAAYNRWMNEGLYGVCAALSDDVRKADRGAFFRSIHGTLNHLLLADKVWMGRFTDRPFAVRSLDQELYADFAGLRSERARMDAAIEAWARGLTDTVLNGELVYTSIVNPERRSSDMAICVMHFFNHQTHHRGQLTTLLSQLGADFGTTDLIAMPEALRA